MSSTDLDADAIDFAIAAWREEGRWIAQALPAQSATTLDEFATSLRRLPGEGGVLGFVGVSDEFFVAVRQTGEHTRAFVSDGTAILDWSLADEVADSAGIQVDDDELEEFEPLGDLSMLADFGLDSTELLFICNDSELYPDEQVRAIAKKIGFEQQIKSLIPAS